MASREQDERELETVVARGLRGWLGRVRKAVMRPWNDWRGMPDATAVYGESASWSGELDTILTHIGRIALGAWSEATDVPPVSRHAFIMASLAESRNFLVRIPDEVADLIFAEISDAINAGSDVAQVALRVDRVLDWTDSERWQSRAEVIARTEVTRARGAGTLAAGTEQSRVTGRVLNKVWRTSHDDRVRDSPQGGHRAADGQQVPFWAPFMVGGEGLMFPGDPNGRPDNVINCRCDMAIRNEVS